MAREAYYSQSAQPYPQRYYTPQYYPPGYGLPPPPPQLQPAYQQPATAQSQRQPAPQRLPYTQPQPIYVRAPTAPTYGGVELDPLDPRLIDVRPIGSGIYEVSMVDTVPSAGNILKKFPVTNMNDWVTRLNNQLEARRLSEQTKAAEAVRQKFALVDHLDELLAGDNDSAVVGIYNTVANSAQSALQTPNQPVAQQKSLQAQVSLPMAHQHVTNAKNQLRAVRAQLNQPGWTPPQRNLLNQRFDEAGKLLSLAMKQEDNLVKDAGPALLVEPEVQKRRAVMYEVAQTYGGGVVDMPVPIVPQAVLEQVHQLVAANKGVVSAGTFVAAANIPLVMGGVVPTGNVVGGGSSVSTISAGITSGGGVTTQGITSTGSSSSGSTTPLSPVVILTPISTASNVGGGQEEVPNTSINRVISAVDAKPGGQSTAQVVVNAGAQQPVSVTSGAQVTLNVKEEPSTSTETSTESPVGAASIGAGVGGGTKEEPKQAQTTKPTVVIETTAKPQTEEKSTPVEQSTDAETAIGEDTSAGGAGPPRPPPGGPSADWASGSTNENPKTEEKPKKPVIVLTKPKPAGGAGGGTTVTTKCKRQAMPIEIKAPGDQSVWQRQENARFNKCKADESGPITLEPKPTTLLDQIKKVPAKTAVVKPVVYTHQQMATVEKILKRFKNNPGVKALIEKEPAPYESVWTTPQGVVGETAAKKFADYLTTVKPPNELKCGPNEPLQDVPGIGKFCLTKGESSEIKALQAWSSGVLEQRKVIVEKPVSAAELARRKGIKEAADRQASINRAVHGEEGEEGEEEEEEGDWTPP